MTAAAVASAEAQPNGIVSNLRAVVSAAAEFVAGVERVVHGSVRTARDNAREALEADRARAQARDEMDRLVRDLLESGPSSRSTGPAATGSGQGRDSGQEREQRGAAGSVECGHGVAEGDGGAAGVLSRPVMTAGR